MVTELRLTAGNLDVKPEIELDHGRKRGLADPWDR